MATGMTAPSIPEETNPNHLDLIGLKDQLYPDVLHRLEQVADQLPQILEMWTEGNFDRFIALIDSIFETHPVEFHNGIINHGETATTSASYTTLINEAGSNLWSLKVFAFAIMMGYTASQALSLFGEHYNDVIEDPNSGRHLNIEQVYKHWLWGVQIQGMPFRIK